MLIWICLWEFEARQKNCSTIIKKGFKLKAETSQIERTKISFRGFVIENNTIQPSSFRMKIKILSRVFILFSSAPCFCCSSSSSMLSSAEASLWSCNILILPVFLCCFCLTFFLALFFDWIHSAAPTNDLADVLRSLYPWLIGEFDHRPRQEKTEAIRNFPTPTTPSEV